MIEYVFGEIVVVKTGRIARKQSGADTSSTKRRPKLKDEENQVMYEIEPAAGDIKWKKWVKDEDLYVIEQHITPSSTIVIPNQIGDNSSISDVSVNEYVKNMLQQTNNSLQEEDE